LSNFLNTFLQKAQKKKHFIFHPHLKGSATVCDLTCEYQSFFQL